MFARAGQPELVRSNQKDVYYLGTLREGVGQIYRNFRGAHSWIRWKGELELLADVCYFGLTTLSRFQTLGEEYCNIVQVDRSRARIPSHLRRGMLVFLHVAGPYLVEKALARFELWMRFPENWPEGLSETLRKFLCVVVPILRTAILYVHRTHLAVFYLTGLFYHIAKRLTGVQYLLVRSSLKDDGSRPTYRLLGYLSIIQLAVTLISSLHQHLKGAKSWVNPATFDSRVPQNTSPGSGVKCALCLERLQNKTATPCGHLFCWECITEWCSDKPECPLCREQVQPSRLVYLHHFEPT